eukprot:731679-Amphidinium_carterae.2
MSKSSILLYLPLLEIRHSSGYFGKSLPHFPLTIRSNYIESRLCGNVIDDSVSTLLQGFHSSGSKRSGVSAARRVLGGSTAADMKVHPSKAVCVGNGKLARKVLQNFTKHRRLPRMVVTTKDLGVDVQWTARRNLTGWRGYPTFVSASLFGPE